MLRFSIAVLLGCALLCGCARSNRNNADTAPARTLSTHIDQNAKTASVSWETPVKGGAKTLSIEIDQSSSQLTLDPSRNGNESVAVIGISYEMANDRIICSASISTKDKGQKTSLTAEYRAVGNEDAAKIVAWKFDGKLPSKGKVVLSTAGGKSVYLAVSDATTSDTKSK